MKCDCDECQGNGKVTCHNCGGSGKAVTCIERMQLYPKMPNFKELSDLKADVSLARTQAERLCALKPHRSESYESQLKAVLKDIDRQAQEIIDSEGGC